MRSRSLFRRTSASVLLTLLGSTQAYAKTGAPARELLLEAVGVYEHQVWFADELAPIADALAEVLGRPRFGFRVMT